MQKFRHVRHDVYTQYTVPKSSVEKIQKFRQVRHDVYTQYTARETLKKNAARGIRTPDLGIMSPAP